MFDRSPASNLRTLDAAWDKKEAERDQRLELQQRRLVDSDLGSAASSLENAASAIERLNLMGIAYPATEAGELLEQFHQLSERVLALQVHVRQQNHHR